ncbi:MAG: DUF1624 domain-containing protein [Kordiimonas sp.]
MTNKPQNTKEQQRLMSIDALRGLVMLFMLVDHARETFFLHMQVADPVDAATVDTGLFFTRLLSTICAPAFVFLTGLSAYLYGQSHSKHETSIFLLKRGFFLMFLELTIIGFVWTGQFPPEKLFLQVIWAIGVCMIVLAVLIHLSHAKIAFLAIVIIAGHNLLDGISFAEQSPFYLPWAMLHEVVFFETTFGVTIKTTYPVLAWIGVIALGYAVGPWFGKTTTACDRQKTLIKYGIAMIVTFCVIRAFNVYGDIPWSAQEGLVRTAIAFLSLTKYPPSLLFLLPTLGLSLILLAYYEKIQERSWMVEKLAILGGAPMFFYILHLYVLRVFYLILVTIYGKTQGSYYGVDHLYMVWAWSLALVVPLYYPSAWFANLKRRRRDIKWLRYL